MSTFPWINFFCMFISLWAATTPRFRTDDAKLNWILFYANLGASGINAVAVLAWVFEWMTS